MQWGVKRAAIDLGIILEVIEERWDDGFCVPIRLMGKRIVVRNQLVTKTCIVSIGCYIPNKGWVGLQVLVKVISVCSESV